jgi:hypothetical protein
VGKMGNKYLHSLDSAKYDALIAKVEVLGASLGASATRKASSNSDIEVLRALTRFLFHARPGSELPRNLPCSSGCSDM